MSRGQWKVRPKPKDCDVPSCPKPSRARGVCEKHYRRELKHGSVFALKRGAKP